MKIITSVNLKEYVDNNPKDAEKDFPEFIRLLIKTLLHPLPSSIYQPEIMLYKQVRME